MLGVTKGATSGLSEILTISQDQSEVRGQRTREKMEERE
jgi:hypothetical protein